MKSEADDRLRGRSPGDEPVYLVTGIPDYDGGGEHRAEVVHDRALQVVTYATSVGFVKAAGSYDKPAVKAALRRVGIDPQKYEDFF